MKIRNAGAYVLAPLSLSFLVVACDLQEPEPDIPGAPAAEESAEHTATDDADIEGEIIEVEMTMSGGGAFEPGEITAQRGDVLRFINVEDVHNVSWPASQNPSGVELPANSPFMTSPGETHDVAVTMPPGTYVFQCDPHVPMGMVGTLEVTE